MTRGRGRNRGARPNPATAGATRSGRSGRRQGRTTASGGRRAAAAAGAAEAAAVVEAESEDETSVQQNQESSVSSQEEGSNEEESNQDEDSTGEDSQGEEASNEEDLISGEDASTEEASEDEGSNGGNDVDDVSNEQDSNGEEGSNGDDSNEEDSQGQEGSNDEDSQGEGQDDGAEEDAKIAKLQAENEEVMDINNRNFRRLKKAIAERDEAVNDFKEQVALGDEMVAEIDRLKAKNARLTGKLDEAKAQRDEAVNDCKELEASGEEKDAEIDRLNAKNDRLKAEIERLKPKNDRLQGNDTSMFKYKYTPKERGTNQNDHNALTTSNITLAFIKMLEPFKNNSESPKLRHQYNIDEVPFELVRDTFSLADDNTIDTPDLPKPVLAGLVTNLNEFGFYQHKKFLEFWRRIYSSGIFVTLQHCDKNFLTYDANNLKKEALAVCVMMILQVPGFADPTIEEDGSLNGKRFSNGRNPNAVWVVDDAEIFDETAWDPAILSEEIVSVMYTNYKHRENLLWAGKYSSEERKHAEEQHKEYCRDIWPGDDDDDEDEASGQEQEEDDADDDDEDEASEQEQEEDNDDEDGDEDDFDL